MKIGIDIHGTIDTDPEAFSILIKKLRKDAKAEIHITTGIKAVAAVEKLKDFGIEYDHLFSITDYHESIGTKVVYDENGDPWIEEETWNRTKADYCKRENIDLHLDDSPLYGEYFTSGTMYIQFEKEAVEFLDILL